MFAQRAKPARLKTTVSYRVRAFNGSCEAFDDVQIRVIPTPNATMLITPAGCAATFTAGNPGSGVNGPLTYAWTFGAVGDAIPSTATGAGPHNVAFRNSGNKTIQLSVSSFDGCSATGFDSFNPACVLPVTLLRFDARWSSLYPMLNWSVLATGQFMEIQIERSLDGQQFSRVGSVPRVRQQRDYQFTDQQLPSQVDRVYYRLRLQDADGRFTYSTVRIVSKSVDGVWQVSPNPFRSSLRLQVPEQAVLRGVQLLDLQGRVVRAFNTTTLAGNRTLIWNDLEQLPVGMYVLRVVLPDTVRQWRIVHE